MTNATGPSFSAADSFLGYIYQCEYALYRLLDRDQPIDAIMIEALDDVQADIAGDPAQLLQLKLHGPGRNLTDRGEDLWKTLRVWASLVAAGVVDPSQTAFFLMTTSEASATSEVAALLAPEPQNGRSTRNVSAANDRLVFLANEASEDPELSANSVRRKGAQAFLGLDAPKRAELVRNIRIVTQAPTVPQLRKQIVYRLRMSGCSDSDVETLAHHLLGWWYYAVVLRLTRDKAPISANTLADQIAELSSAFALKSLRQHRDIAEPDAATLEDYRGWTFVRQLGALRMTDTGVLVGRAMIEFYRAEGHIQRWTQELQLTQAELEDFENELLGHWAMAFGLAEAGLNVHGAALDDVVFVKAGQDVFRDAMAGPGTKLKGFEGEFVRRGCFHRLANRPVIGWHPLWRAKFQAGGSE